MTEQRATYLAELRDHEKAIWAAAYVHALETAWKGGHARDIASEAVERADHAVEALRTALNDEETVAHRRGHLPVLNLNLAFVIGCTCGWKTPPGSTNSDETYTQHVACVRVLEKSP